MTAPSRSSLALSAALARMLRPLVRLMLRHSMPFGAFEEIAKRAYVDVALKEFSIPGRKPSISRASILSGLTRKEVQRLNSIARADVAAGSERYNRAARVLTAWSRDPDFLSSTGQPRALGASGPESFAALAKRHSGDMPARAVLDELLRVGAVRRLDDGQFEPTARAYVPQKSVIDKLVILGSDVAALIDTIDHNLKHGETDPRFQRKVMYQHVSVAALPAFRKLSAAQAQALLEKLDRWLGEHSGDAPADGAGTARVGMGIYYFEERVAPVDPEQDQP
jgi:hypothetical protein